MQVEISNNLPIPISDKLWASDKPCDSIIELLHQLFVSSIKLLYIIINDLSINKVLIMINYLDTQLRSTQFAQFIIQHQGCIINALKE